MCPIRPLLCLLTLLLTLAIGAVAAAAPKVSDWDALIPPQHHPAQILARHGVRFLDLSKPAERAIFEEIEAARRLAPVVPELDGSDTELRGFVVPLDGDGEATTAFLLVPEYGYCIHVPPPPANQLVLVRAPDAKRAWGLFSEVVVRGRLRIESSQAVNGTAGYAIEAREVASAP